MKLRFDQRGFSGATRVQRNRPVGLIAISIFTLVAGWRIMAVEIPDAVEFRNHVQPLLEEFCYDCHADGMNKGKVAFDEFASDYALLENRGLWWKALKNLRAGMMPPAKKPQPAPEQKVQIEEWIKSAVFKIDPQNPDPGQSDRVSQHDP